MTQSQVSRQHSRCNKLVRVLVQQALFETRHTSGRETLRIVRAAKVQQARRRSGTWRANEQHRLHQLHERSQTAPIATPVRQPYTWREQTEISIDTGATSGAAAVILKRRRAAACVNKDAPEDKRRGTAGGEQSTQHTRERRVDSQLIFTTNTHRLYVDRITFWRWWPRTGDG